MTGVPERFERKGNAWLAQDHLVDSDDQCLSVRSLTLGDPMLNARTIRKDAFFAAGGFSLDYPYCSDRDFLLQLHQQAVLSVEMSERVYRYRWHEGFRTMNYGNNLAGKIAEECLLIAERWMNRVDHPDRHMLRKWHAKVSHQQVLRALEEGKLPTAVQSMRRALSTNPAWPAGFLAEFSRCFAGYVARGCRTKSQVRRQAEESVTAG